jgi:hemin uptake protein HemP
MSELEQRIELTKAEGPDSQSPRIVRTDELFRGDQEIWIEHRGALYRLRITRRNRLILQK